MEAAVWTWSMASPATAHLAGRATPVNLTQTSARANHASMPSNCLNLVGDYECHCRNGWEGKNCNINLNDCLGQCLNGATCIDLVDDYHCACSHGYTGE
ncbi:jagged-1b-like [Homarus americanus]|uniref:Jagged-1b-like n=1 Tax=Homarus americanus TaxID=6706 RepID=A0A8J5N609_HOMAM|nr:jagged-1b-like [Homarus americanus]